MQEEPKYIAGAKKNPDGTWDYSQAAHLEDPKRGEADLDRRRRELEEIWNRSRGPQVAHNTAADVQGVMEGSPEIVLNEGGIRVHMSVESNVSGRSNSGFQNLETRIRDGLQPSMTLGKIEGQFLKDHQSFRGGRLREELKEQGINELIDIRHEMKPVYKEIKIPAKKGFLGMGRLPERVERKPTGEYEPVLHSEIVDGGKEEPAVRFTYYVPSSEWRDYSGRPGQEMIVEIVLPESVAKEVEQEIDRDPTVIRRIVERVMKEKLLKDPDAWETPQKSGDSLRPPYEKWDDREVYIQKEELH